MKNSMTMLVTAAVAAVFSLSTPARASAVSFVDHFDGTLDPAWSVFAGSRNFGLPAPANHYSLDERPGFLRYYLDPMTHSQGYGHNYQPTPTDAWGNRYDPGLEFSRPLGGNNWQLETKIDFYMPFGITGRQFATQIWFGEPGPEAKSVSTIYWRDPGSGAHQFFFCVDGASCRVVPLNFGAPANSSLWLRFNRDDGEVGITYSQDGDQWNLGGTYDWGDALDGRRQTVALSGASWWYPAGSFADWDYVDFRAQGSPLPTPGGLSLWLAGLAAAAVVTRRQRRDRTLPPVN